MPTKRKSEKFDPSGLSFEEAMAELEAIVDAMEAEQLPLGEIVARYEAGSALLKHCGSVLSAARKRIELITLSGSGEPEPEQDSGDPDESNDTTLF